MPKPKSQNQREVATKTQIDKLLDEQTDVILTSVRDIVKENYGKLEKRISSLEGHVARLVSTLEHYIKKAEDLDEEFTFLKARLRRVEEKLGIAKEY